MILETKVGCFIRKTKNNELPQFFDVLRRYEFNRVEDTKDHFMLKSLKMRFLKDNGEH